jgi:hypothetical protein
MWAAEEALKNDRPERGGRWEISRAGGRFNEASGRGLFETVQSCQRAGKTEEKEQEAVHHGETPDFSGVVSP